MDEVRIAQHAHEHPARDWRAIRERSTRGLLAFNRGDVLHLEGDCWAVRSSRGGYWKVDLDCEVCDCPDFVHYGREHDVCCKHLFAVAIAHGTRRSPRRRPSCPSCLGGYVTITVEEDGREFDEAVPCRRCNE